MHEEFYQNPQFWVIVAFVAFVLLAYKKVSALLVGMLDERSRTIARDLEAARKLREEAEVVLADYKAKQAAYVKEAEDMLAKAKSDAAAMAAHADKELRAAMEERTQNALKKIAQEEANAIAEVRAHVVDVALAAARTMITKQMDDATRKQLLDQAVADIERKVH